MKYKNDDVILDKVNKLVQLQFDTLFSRPHSVNSRIETIKRYADKCLDAMHEMEKCIPVKDMPPSVRHARNFLQQERQQWLTIVNRRDKNNVAHKV